ncbi:isoprenyl transferase [Mangrovibacterium marinum]|uniref:Isoprenyl transferase n=1 Tax=Mangrovibacterium marinum TaxID=1639118 RepID=A0A2T5C3X1_9BACT|nr:isoprenyl transferase [Mangrovibacterium marinum]PTN09513.1 undecaprenyl diphosphate synthase [Mangrovibacterium marinum]
MTLKDKLNTNKIPEHVAIIMDGNGRWAALHGNERVFGHENGVESVRSVVEGAAEIGIKYLTLYAFSTENWSRPQAEVDALMGLLVHAINNETEELKRKNVKLSMIGDVNSLPGEVQQKLNWSIEELKDCNGLQLVLALSYSSRWEITEAMRQIAVDVKDEKIEPQDINKELIDKYLATNGIPDPELLIRTSGEARISNFLLWQIAYTEFYFTPVLWPDFNKENLFEAVYDFQNRERRFGKTSQQIVS